MNLADQLAPVLALAAAKGVEFPPPPDAYYSERYGCWIDSRTDAPIRLAEHVLCISAWLAGQGIAVFFLFEKWWRFYGIKCDGIVLPGTESIPDADSHLSALLAAATARLAELPSAAPASKEGE